MKAEDKEILERYANDKASVPEQVRAEKLLCSYESAEMKESFKRQWDDLEETSVGAGKDLSNTLSKVHYQILKKYYKKKSKYSFKFLRTYSSVAAVAMVILLVGVVVLYSKLQISNKLLAESSTEVSIESNTGSLTSFDMPDGTKVVLNQGSSLQYSLPFANNRVVELKGEAYFDVAHDKDHPFEVVTTDLNVNVLGTKFNVRAYEDDDFTEVTLENGKVACSIGDENYFMNPDECLVLEENKVTKTKVDASEYTAWSKGKIVLRGKSMEEVVKILSRWYRADIEIHDEELKAYSFRGTFHNSDSLEDVLEILKLSSPIDFKIYEQTSTGNSRLPKKKVVISKL